MDVGRFIRRLKRWKEVRGFRYQCPMCHYPLGSFKPYGYDLPALDERQVIGGGRREHAKCYICGCLDRERLIFMYLKYHTQFFKQQSTILHFAPEPLLSKALRTHNKSTYTTADIVDGRADMTIDMLDIPFSDNHFDLIIANHILEHIPDDNKALSELRRVLKVNQGIAILQVPISLNNQQTFEDFSVDTDLGRLNTFGQEDHIRIYGQDYPEKLRLAGFDVIIFDWNKSSQLRPKDKNKYRFIEQEKIYIVK
jgi:SAM-dependent methyltransferase